MRRCHIVPVLCALLVAGPALAGDVDDRAAQIEQQRERLRQKWEQRFRDADTDESRTLSPAEIEAAKLPRSLSRRFAEIDRDGDGGLSPEELLAAQEKRIRGAAAASPTDAPTTD